VSFYRYRAIDAAGRTVRGTLQAANTVDLERRLRRMGFELVRAAPQQTLRRAAHRRRVGRRELIQFCFHLEQLAAAGIPLLDGLCDLRDGVTHAGLRQVVSAMIESIEGGQNLSQALAEHPAVFDGVFVGLVRSGEHAGKLPEVLASLAAQLRWEDELAAQTRTLLFYPLFVGAVVACVTLFLLLYLVPQLAGFIRGLGHELPLQTVLLLRASELCVRYGWVLAALACAAPVAWRLLARRHRGLGDTIDRAKLGLPFLGPILRKIILSRFASSFALMYASGIMILDALRHAEAIVANRQMQRALRRATRQVADGKTLTGAFAEAGVFPPLVIRMLHVGERTGALDTALQNVSYFYNREVREAIAGLQAVLEPLLTVVLGALLAWVMLAVLGPIYDTIAGVKL
jgi:type IV pilus assembly protein PilC